RQRLAGSLVAGDRGAGRRRGELRGDAALFRARVGSGAGRDRGTHAARGGAVMGPAALDLRDLRKSFGKTEIIRGVSLSIPRGERHAIIGPNGAGKSTLFNLISGRFASTSGRTELNCEDVTGGRPLHGYRKRLARGLQNTNLVPAYS